MLLSAFDVFQNHLDKLTLVVGLSPFFCPYLFINKLNKADIFSAQNGRTIYDCHLSVLLTLNKSNNK